MAKRIRKIEKQKRSATALHPLRVAAYCRISSNTNEQENSLDAQIAYYSEFIAKRADWICVGIFSDVGSGRNTKSRPSFVDLMKLCRKKKVDLILTKSVSRFGRNTVDSIKAMRELQALGIDVWFEAERLRLQNKKNQFVLEIFSALAQAESESKSKNIR